MDDTIYRQEAIKTLLELTTFKTKRELVERIESSIADENGWLGGVAECMDEIEDLPSADVQQVVRCRDCKWFNKIGCAIKIVDESDKPHEDDFCSFAERRTDESD